MTDYMSISVVAIVAIQGSRTLTFVERPSISTELCLVESHIDFKFNLLKFLLLLQISDDLLILDCLFSHLIWSDVMILVVVMALLHLAPIMVGVTDTIIAY